MIDTLDHLSASTMASASKCLYKVYLAKEMGYREPSGIAQHRGRGTYKAVERDMRSKIDTGELLGVGEVEDVARDTVNDIWFEDPPQLVGDELTVGDKKLKGETVDAAVRLARLHHVDAAPLLMPTHAERPFSISIPDCKRDLWGYIDLDTETAVHDVKAVSKTPPQDAADVSLQLTCYAMFRYANGEQYDNVHIDGLVDLKSGPKTVRRSSKRGLNDFHALVTRIRSVSDTLDAGNFPPTDPANWWCSKKWCGFFLDACPYGRRGRVVG